MSKTTYRVPYRYYQYNSNQSFRITGIESHDGWKQRNRDRKSNSYLTSSWDDKYKSIYSNKYYLRKQKPHENSKTKLIY